MISDRTLLIRQLVPKSYHFDGYNEINCRNSRDKPFFANNTVNIGKYTLTTNFVDIENLSLNYESVCPNGNIIFEPYTLSLTSFIKKLRQASNTSSDFITFSIKVKVIENDRCSNCKQKNKDCTHIRQSKNQNEILAAVSFNSKEVKEALAYYFEILPKKNNESVNGGHIMKKKNNFMGLNFEFGLSKDSNIVSTLMGVAIKNPKTGEYTIFDKANNKLTNISNMKMGNLPIYLLPTKDLSVGTLIKRDSSYYYVQEIKNDGTVSLLQPSTGEIKNILLSDSLIPGMTFHTQVVAMDMNSLTNLSSNESVGTNVLAAMCMMNWSKGSSDDEFSLDSIDEDSFNGLGKCWPLLMAMNGNNNSMNQFTTLMLLGGGDDSDETMQMFALSQLLNGKSPFEGLFSENTHVATVNNGSDDSVMCENCHTHYPAGTNFCPKCGINTVSIATTCKSCGATLMENAVFCQVCGAKVVKDSCPTCGCKIDANQNFCHGCGTNLKCSCNTKTCVAQENVPDKEPTNTQPTEEK